MNTDKHRFPIFHHSNTPFRHSIIPWAMNQNIGILICVRPFLSVVSIDLFTYE
jgi:hypothetical protein